MTEVNDLPYATSTLVPLEDPSQTDYDDIDDSVEVDIGFMFTFFGETYDTVFVGSNGYLTFGEPDFDFTPKNRAFNGIPRVAGLFTDLLVGNEGTVTYSSSSDRFAVSYERMTHWDDFDSSFINMQIALFPDGTVEIIHSGTELLC